jgi:hypothetical protein
MVFVFRSVAARYCFVEFADDVSARQALESLNNQTIPGTSGVKRFKLNWANRKADSGQVDYNVFVADISRDVTSQQLIEFFQQNYKSIRYAKVVEDEEGASKGYGFIRFMDEQERDLCLVEMDGAMGLGRKPLTIKPALAPRTRVPAMPVSDGASVHGVSAASAQQWPPPRALLPVAYTPHPPHPVPHVSMPPLVYIEDLVDPNPPTSGNDSVIQKQTELFLALDSCRWKALTDIKLL